MIHLADVHLGMENYGKMDKATGFHSRLKDFLDTFDQAVEFAEKNQVDLVVFAGDAFKNRDPNPTQQREFAKRIKRLSKAGIMVVLLVGNHDLPNSDSKAHSMEIYNTLEVDGVYVIKKPQILKINTKSGMVQVIAVPYASKSILLSREEYKDLSIEEINNLIGEKITTTVSVLSKGLDAQTPSVLAAHLSVANAKVGSERSIMLGNELVIPVSALALPDFDYVALGHIHKFQVIKEDPPVIYSGSLDRIDFNEEFDPKGFVFVNLVRNKTSYNFIELKTRPFLTLKILVSSDDNTSSIVEKILMRPLDLAIVRLILEVTPEDFERLDLKEIIKVIEERCFYLAGITKQWIKDTSLLRDPELTERVLPMEALKKYLHQRLEVTLDKGELLKRAEILLQEVKREERGVEYDTGTN